MIKKHSLLWPLCLALCPVLGYSCKTSEKDLGGEGKGPESICIVNVSIANDRLWVSDSYRGEHATRAMAMDEPFHPKEIFTVKNIVDTQNVVVDKGFAHLFGAGLITTFDVRDESNVRQIGFSNYSGIMYGRSVAVKDEKFYISGNRLTQAEFVENRLRLKSDYQGLTNSIDVRDLILTEDYIYTLWFFGGLQVVDYKSADGFKTVHSIPLLNAQHMGKLGNYLYLVGVTPHPETTSEDDVGLQIVDISKPAEPRYVKSIPIAGKEKDIVVWNGKIYVSGVGFIDVFDASEPESPQFLQRLDLTNLGGNLEGINGAVENMAVRSDGIAYVALTCQDWLILDLRANPIKIVKRL